MLAGGVESMSRAPFVMGKADSAYSRAAIYDTTIGWRFINKLMKAQYGVDSMPETAENVADDFKISREDQDLFALASQQRPPARRRKATSTPKSCPCRSRRRRRSIIVSRTSIRVKPRMAAWSAKRRQLGRERRPDAARAWSAWPPGVAPHHGHRPGAATRKVLAQTGLTLEQMD